MRKNNISQYIYEDLRTAILNLKLLPGTRISEIEISKNYSVSRTPVKNALTHLEHEGLIIVKPNIGSFVSKLDKEKITTHLEIREIVETSIVMKIIEKMDDVLLLELELNVARQEKLLKELDEVTIDVSIAFMELDDMFHQIIFKFAHKGYLWDSLQREQIHYARYRRLVGTYALSTLKSKVDEHKAIIKLLKEDSPEIYNFYHHHIFSSSEQEINFFLQKYQNYFTT